MQNYGSAELRDGGRRGRAGVGVVVLNADLRDRTELTTGNCLACAAVCEHSPRLIEKLDPHGLRGGSAVVDEAICAARHAPANPNRHAVRVARVLMAISFGVRALQAQRAPERGHSSQILVDDDLKTLLVGAKMAEVSVPAQLTHVDIAGLHGTCCPRVIG